MPEFDPSLFTDVADALGISSPVIVEKDYYAVQLLGELSDLTIDGYTLVFAGGTCLAKAYQNTYRMSEDIDIKLVPSSDVLTVPHNKQRQLRRDIHQAVLSTIETSAFFTLSEPAQKQNEGRHQRFLIEYPQYHGQMDSLRPHLQLDITESTLLEPSAKKSIRSLYAEVVGLDHEIPSFACVTVESTACEKFVSLLRRTAAFDRDSSRVDDETLIRHVYDLHLIATILTTFKPLHYLVDQVIEMDVEQFGNQQEAFRKNPRQELRRGLQLLVDNPHHKARYEKFIGPLVYHPSPASWDEAIESVIKMASEWLQ